MRWNSVLVIFAILFLNICGINACSAQVGLFVDKDYRIADFQDSIFRYLILQKQFSDKTKDMTLMNYKDRFFIRKRIEIYLDGAQGSLLLIRFGANADHSDHFWGLLGKECNYFFYNFSDPGWLLFRKTYPSTIIDPIEFYCKNQDH
ncbi:hypothetical protein [Desertivirga arenae]|uniref:hypothetical protein n=1 Tax=Desertivirga arenae TaxID=2810309 RepID=UPI001A95937C|nr:hypothetical protein [Pedobacter sp. SYSU D00823]